ncbi:hypothetical protein [Methylococcus sp. EFPC2]|uniref:hypothetical protein n=1 Tax=Methylococcus sp. EFPC2 TaxID=2812648 RepID=UPI001967EEEA|nr:hypothetical protein [Methylococcus sp. EFPC2]QSA98725.1 hypothetical protein JWZ97_08060 [Methylococcus sp. EFPC2]
MDKHLSPINRATASGINPLIKDDLRETAAAVANVINLLACATTDASDRGYPTGEGLCFVLEVVHAALKFEIDRPENADLGAAALTPSHTANVVAAETQGGHDHG